MIRVLLADDQELVRAGLPDDPRRRADIEVVGEAADGARGGRARRAALAPGRRADGHPHAGPRRHRGDAPDRRRGRRCRRACSSSPRSTSTSTSTTRCAPARAASCSRTRRRRSWSTAVRVVAAGDALLAPVGHPAADRGASRSRPPPASAAAPRSTSSPRASARCSRLVARGPVERRDRRASSSLSDATVEDARRAHPARSSALRDRVQAVVLAYESGAITPGAG